jgi:2-polyprenyl-6-methoxyphenol hydroxylase-like FAD-dependent oxidoreductase
MRILVVGGGIAGLGASLALAGRAHEILVLDRDPPPPTGTMNEIFATWERPGATQLRHSHVFLARIHNLLRDRYPELLAQLTAAGARELRFRDGLSPRLRASYVPRSADTDLSILSCRRTTLEAIMRRFAARLPGVQLLNQVKVRGIRLSAGQGEIPRISHLEIEQGGKLESLAGDLVVDACGRNSQFPDWLAAAGIKVPIEEASSGVLYYTRHYRLRSGESEPDRARSNIPSAGDLGYIRYCIFPADDGNFSVTLALPEIETELRQSILDLPTFDRICAALPAIAQWTDARRAVAVSKVLAMGNLKSVWRDWTQNERPLLLDFFAIGDSTMTTNPLYGRGCATGILHAQMLADVVRATHDPVARAKFFAARTAAELRPFFDAMVAQDAAWMLRAARARSLGRRTQLRARLMRSFAEDALIPATRGSLRVARRLARPFHMLEPPSDWLKEPATVARLLATWATPRGLKAHLYPGRLGPARRDMLALARVRESA